MAETDVQTASRDGSGTGPLHVVVLKGGRSPEREVSLVSGAAYADAARELGYRVDELDPGPDLGARLIDLKPDVVLNGLHGRWGEDGCVQGLLELLDIPYTHSGVLASALAMDKQRAKDVFRAAGIPVVDSVVAPRETVAARHIMEPPYVVKPVNQGSSVGVFVVRQGDNRPPQELTDPTWDLGEEVMVEAFVPGRELTVGVMDGKALGVTEILPTTNKFYDYEAKYAEGGSRHVVPAQIPDAVAEAAKRYAVLAHEALGCKGVTRADFRFNEAFHGGPDGALGHIILLEVNTQPGMTPTSLVPEQALAVGLSFTEIVRWIVEDASCPR